MKITSVSVVFFFAATLVGCGTTYQQTTESYDYSYDTIEYTPQSNNRIDYEQDTSVKESSVTLPDSYHLGTYHAPTPAKVQDKNWISSQNPYGYTIEVADGDKPIAVANRLAQVPKSDRSAEIKYQRNGKAYYKAVFGSYQNKEQAESALHQLPAAIKQDARIKNWSSIQGTLD